MNMVTKAERERLIGEVSKLIRLDQRTMMCLNFDECVMYLITARGISRDRARRYTACAVRRARGALIRAAQHDKQK